MWRLFLAQLDALFFSAPHQSFNHWAAENISQYKCTKMQSIYIVLSVIAGVILGVVSNWIYDISRNRGYLPDRPSLKRVVIVVFVFLPIVLFVALPAFLDRDDPHSESGLEKNQITPIYSEPYIADWIVPHSYLSDELLVFQKSCKDDEGFSSAIGSSPAYHVILESWFALTFVNPNSIPDGIIQIEPVYNTDFEKQWQLDVWYVTMYETNDLEDIVFPPIELPPNTPVKRYFKVVHVLDVHPDISASAIYKYADEELSPLRLTFTATEDSQIVYTIDLQQYAPEALNDGKFKFEKDCSDILSNWPVPMAGRSLGKGE